MRVGREVSTTAVLAGCGVELFSTTVTEHDLLYYYFSRSKRYKCYVIPNGRYLTYFLI